MKHMQRLFFRFKSVLLAVVCKMRLSGLSSAFVLDGGDARSTLAKLQVHVMQQYLNAVDIIQASVDTSIREKGPLAKIALVMMQGWELPRVHADMQSVAKWSVQQKHLFFAWLATSDVEFSRAVYFLQGATF